MRTRFTRISEALWGKAGPASDIDGDDIVRRILAIADERAFWGCTEISTYTGRSRAVVQNWHRRHQADFPSPHQVLAMGPLWDREQVKLWCLEHPGLMGDESPADAADPYMNGTITGPALDWINQ